MLFTPNYAVSYKGRFYQAGEQFEIAENDVAEMSRHGIVQPFDEQEPPENELPPEEDEQEPPGQPKRAGRNRKGVEQ